MEKAELKRLIDVSAGRVLADTVIKNCKVINVYSGCIEEGDIAICGGVIAGVGQYDGVHTIDAQGAYAAPGFIDSHIHIESSYLSPQELSRLIVPRGTTTIIADAHEIANVCGLTGLNYMIEAAKGTALDVQWVLPSCVPATSFENSGAVIDAEAMKEPLASGKFLGLGEFMDFPGVVNGVEGVLDKLVIAQDLGVRIDGHCPGLTGNALNAYAAARISTDHECSTAEGMLDRLKRGMYVLLRQGSACHDLRKLLKGVTPLNSRRCLLCTDDCQPRTIISEGHLDHHLRICVEEGIDPIVAIQMVSLNAAECYGLKDRGAIAPGLRADIVLFDSLQDFSVQKVLIQGSLVAAEREYLLPITRHDITATKGRFAIRDYSADKLRLPINTERAHAIKIMPGGVVTAKEVVEVKRNAQQEFVYDPAQDLVKIAVLERYRGTGDTAVALLKGYGIKQGAVAISISHDSHNIVVVGASDEDMVFAVEELVKQEGGVVLVKDRQILESLPLPIAGLMSEQSGVWVDQKLRQIHKAAHQELGVSRDVEPLMTLCFMSLPVIPEIKLTAKGLFDVSSFSFIPIEA